MRTSGESTLIRCRTAFISDVHLGHPACGAGSLIAFLNALDCESLYLVGDIVDVESMRRWFYWPKTHEQAARKILDMARRGTRVVYIPGDHVEARRRGAGGIVCGHIHRPKLEKTGDVVYSNCGDWVESCTALIERHDGTLELLHWPTVAAAPRYQAAA